MVVEVVRGARVASPMSARRHQDADCTTSYPTISTEIIDIASTSYPTISTEIIDIASQMSSLQASLLRRAAVSTKPHAELLEEPPADAKPAVLQTADPRPPVTSPRHRPSPRRPKSAASPHRSPPSLRAPRVPGTWTSAVYVDARPARAPMTDPLLSTLLPPDLMPSTMPTRPEALFEQLGSRKLDALYESFITEDGGLDETRQRLRVCVGELRTMFETLAAVCFERDRALELLQVCQSGPSPLCDADTSFLQNS